ncbi:MAG: FAD-dependent oxidoreductase, partial [Chloroflexi bacterium]|nr:FAD-dependent oxidoreductase [Chloroflexota bacterium]
AQKDKIVSRLTSGLGLIAKQRKVRYVRGRGRFTAPTSLHVRNESELVEFDFDYAVVATGSRPALPGPLRLDSPLVMDSTGALELHDIPERLLVVGGGYIGLEMGSVYAALGSRVTVVEMLDGLLPGVDRDLVRPLQRRLEKEFSEIRLNTQVSKLEEHDGGIRATLSSDDGSETLQVDRVLVAVGRTPNSGDLGLEQTAVQVDERGFVTVDAQRRTSEPSIFAIGDVAGEPMLAHKATREGRVAVQAIAGHPVAFDPAAIPAVVYTDPEVAWCGLTQAEAETRHNLDVDVVRYPWGASGRAVTLGHPEGVTKLILEQGTQRVLGVGITGRGAGEMIAEGALAVEMGARAEDLELTIHAHPTLSETVMEAAESRFGDATHYLSKPLRERS